MARGRFGERGADYNPPIGRAIRNAESFSIQAKGYSFTFSHNFRGWKTFTDDIKKKMLEAALAEIKSTVREVGRGAIARAPHYSGALEHSIKVSVPEITSLKGRGRITAIVGVLDSWQSNYDKIAAAGGYPTSSPELIAYIHDYYDDFIGETKDGLKRKRRKEAAVGERVGSRFLTRAWYDIEQSNNLAKGIAKRLFSYNENLSEDAINAMLERAADQIDGEMDE